MKSLVLIASAASIAALAPTAAFAGTQTLRPATGWLLQSGGDTCRVVRVFGTRDPVTMIVEQAGVRQQPDMLFASKGFGRIAKQNRVELDFEGIELGHFYSRTVGKAANGDPLLIFPGIGFYQSGRVVGSGRGARLTIASQYEDVALRERLSAQEAARAAATTGIKLSVSNGNKALLETGSMAPAMQLLSACLDTKLAAMNLDPATERGLSRFPRPNQSPRTWLDDYDRVGTSRDAITLAFVRVKVDAEGKVSDCLMRSPADGAAFEAKACETIRRKVSFVPARSRDGTPTASTYVANIPR